MVGESLFLLVDVEFLDVEDELLLEAVLVVLHAEALLQAVEYAFAYLLGALHLVGFDGCEQCGNVVELFAELLLQRGALLSAEVHELLHGFLHYASCHGPFLIGELLHLGA